MEDLEKESSKNLPVQYGNAIRIDFFDLGWLLAILLSMQYKKSNPVLPHANHVLQPFE